MRDAMRLFYDTETKAVVTDVDLEMELKALQKRKPEYKNFTLADYIISNLTINGGTLEEL
jgi:hypothetical protein